MREYQRIDRILGKLRAVWATDPDLRLAQIIVNATGGHAPFVFNFEDESLEEVLDLWLANDAKDRKK